MCGITGVFDLRRNPSDSSDILPKMVEAIRHRGPDDMAIYTDYGVGLGFRRLSIIDLKTGQQPFFSQDGSVVMICNGEIYNYKEIRRRMESKGYVFQSQCDVEVILNLYLEYGDNFIEELNGQFAFVVFDKRDHSLLIARDHFGICPLFYTQVGGIFIFGSEVKSILQHPQVHRSVNLTGLDQVFSLPGTVSPESMFTNVYSLKPGNYLKIKNGSLAVREYWDLDYPESVDAENHKGEAHYLEGIEDQLLKSVRYRLGADVPVGFYLSGGLDSSLIGAMMNRVKPDEYFKSFSIVFPDVRDREKNECRYQRMVSDHIGSNHYEINFDRNDIQGRLVKAVYHSEAPLKETYNTCSLALSQMVNANGVKVVLSGEGADELFGGYVGYRFDRDKGARTSGNATEFILEREFQRKLWGDPDFFYESSFHELKDIKLSVYSKNVTEQYQKFDCLSKLEINKARLAGRNDFHKRSYLDLKLRLSDHLISDHCDRVSYAHSVEGRYPFLDIELVKYIREVPTGLMLKGLNEKYLLKQIGRKYLPHPVLERSKFGFVAPGSPELLQQNHAWINDLLSYDRIKRQGYFNPDTIETLKKIYSADGFRINWPFEPDLLIIVLTFNIFLDTFDLPSL